MAKKIGYVVEASARKNLEKGGAWLATFSIHDEINQQVTYTASTAWTNANAAKRWFKSQVVERTTRKTMKFTTVATDANEKATAISGTLIFKS